MTDHQPVTDDQPAIDHQPMTDHRHDCTCGTDEEDQDGEALGLPIPDEHLGAFVAEVFEDVEQSTSWADVEDHLVAPSARDAWDALDPAQQVIEVLEMAADYDREAVERLADIDESDPSEAAEPVYREAVRYRRNADMLRSGIADAYASGVVVDDDLVDAVEDAGFDTSAIAEREEELERVATAFGFDFRPYGGTLMDEGDRPEASAAPEW